MRGCRTCRSRRSRTTCAAVGECVSLRMITDRDTGRSRPACVGARDADSRARCSRATRAAARARAATVAAPRGSPAREAGGGDAAGGRAAAAAPAVPPPDPCHAELPSGVEEVRFVECLPARASATTTSSEARRRPARGDKLAGRARPAARQAAGGAGGLGRHGAGKYGREHHVPG